MHPTTTSHFNSQSHSEEEFTELRERGAFLRVLEWEGDSGACFLGVREHTFSLYRAGDLALHFDLEGRLRRAFFPELGERGVHFLRSLDGHLSRRSRGVRVQPHPDRHQVFARTHAVVLEALDSISHPGRRGDGDEEPCLELLHRAAAYDPLRLEGERERFLEVYRPLGVLPPECYRSLILQVTEGCSYNKCAFCDLYREQRFRIKSPAEVREHLQRVKAFLGSALSLRKGVFLGEANALLAPQETLVETLDMVRAELPRDVLGLEVDRPERAPQGERSAAGRAVEGISSFLDVFTHHRKGVVEFSVLRERGLRRVFLGVESGDEELLESLEKPATSEAVRKTVEILKAARLSVGVVLLVGVGGDRFQGSHVGETVELVRGLPLDAADVVYLSPLVIQPGGSYEAWAAARRIRKLSSAELRDQEAEIRRRLRSFRSETRTKIATYDLQRFMYY